MEKGQCTRRLQNCKFWSSWFSWLPAVAPEGGLFYGQFGLKDREYNPQKRRPRNLVPTEPWAPASEVGVGSDFQSLQRSGELKKGVCSLLRTPPGVHGQIKRINSACSWAVDPCAWKQTAQVPLQRKPHCCNPAACPGRCPGNTPDHTWAKGKKRQLPLPATVNTAAQEKDGKKAPRNPVRGPTREAVKDSHWSKTSRLREQMPPTAPELAGPQSI